MNAEFPLTEAEIWSRTIQAGVGDLSPEAAREWLRLRIWSRTIQAGVGDLSPEAAREWLRLRICDADSERVRVLSHKANSGQLTSSEERELDSYLNVGRVLEFLKAKARLSLRNHPAA